MIYFEITQPSGFRPANLQVTAGQYLSRSGAVAVATDSSRRSEEPQIKPQSCVKIDNTLRCLIRKQHRPAVLRQQLGRAHLIVPGKSTGAVGCELNIVWRIGVDEIVRLDRKPREIFVREFPATKQSSVGVKVSCVIDPLVLAKRDVEFTAAIEATQAIETSAVQIIEELRRFLRPSRTILDELVEARAMRVEKLSVVASIDSQRQTATNLPVEIDQMRIDVTQQSSLRLQSKRDCQPAAEWLNVTTIAVLSPNRLDMWKQPALAAGPLQWRS